MSICQLCIRVRGSGPLRFGVFRTRPGNRGNRTTEIDFVTSSFDFTSTPGLHVTNNPPFKLVYGRIGMVNEDGADAGVLASHG